MSTIGITNPYQVQVVVAAAYWNPADKDPDVTLSGALNQIASSSVFGSGSVRSITSHSTGKYAYQITASAFEIIFGIGNASASIFTYPGSDTNSLGFDELGASIIQNNGITSYGTTAAATDRMQMCVDLDGNLLYIRKNGTFMAGGDPSAGTGGFSFTPISTPVFIMAQPASTNVPNSITLETDGALMRYPLPTGYSGWG